MFFKIIRVLIMRTLAVFPFSRHYFPSVSGASPSLDRFVRLPPVGRWGYAESRVLNIQTPAVFPFSRHYFPLVGGASHVIREIINTGGVSSQ